MTAQFSGACSDSKPPPAGPPEQQEEPAPDLALAAAGGPLEEITEVNNETPAAARAELYRSRAALFMTTRILVVDLLNKRLLPSQVRIACCSVIGHASHGLLAAPSDMA